ncbi:hypothetical protein IRJ41_025615 [Triplophysa rosa]|uniref:Uncharacterized protein n=1 Tax=Triplophysa rosa TaxID=992332 RepID=A0A9W7WIZ7_TRIRA|nr:hypothetical protein IRJ41_025615 [Triplophysa rosa]
MSVENLSSRINKQNVLSRKYTPLRGYNGQATEAKLQRKRERIPDITLGISDRTVIRKSHPLCQHFSVLSPRAPGAHLNLLAYLHAQRRRMQEDALVFMLSAFDEANYSVHRACGQEHSLCIHHPSHSTPAKQGLQPSTVPTDKASLQGYSTAVYPAAPEHRIMPNNGITPTPMHMQIAHTHKHMRL